MAGVAGERSSRAAGAPGGRAAEGADLGAPADAVAAAEQEQRPGLAPSPGELCAFAERLLLSDRLADKLLPLQRGASASVGPGAFGAPAAPGRPDGLRFAPRGARPPKPSDGALADPAARAALLHDFANHELLAIELMALCLLRWPDAPLAFRRGLAAVIHEEQRHLHSYIDRIGVLGASFGDHPLNGFFYLALSGAPSPLAFVEGMSLVLEQANLDFCSYWSARLRRLGDAPSAALLEAVREDEIGHLRHGLRWSRAWRPAGDDDWARLQAQAEPLGLGRCTGPVFDAEGRARAGLSAEAIQALSLQGRSRDRPPAVWSFEPGVEEAALDLARGRRPGPPSGPAAALRRDLAAVPLALMNDNDVIVVPSPPAADWLAHLVAAGLPRVEWLGDPGALAGRALGPARPWGWPGAPAWGSGRPDPTPDPALWGKVWAAEQAPAVRAALGLPAEGWPAVVRSEGELEAAVAQLGARHPIVLLRAPFGASGRGAQRWPGPPSGAQRRWAARVLAEQGALVLSPWLARALDLSAHADLSPAGELRLRGQVRFHNDAQGRFLGASTHAPQLDLPPPLARALAEAAGQPGGPAGLAAAVFGALRPGLVAAGYHGPLGLDQLLYAAGQRPALDRPADPSAGPFSWLPLVELNPRFTFGRIALALRARQSPRARGRLRLAPAALIAQQIDLQRRPSPRLDGEGRLLEAVVPLTDPRCAERAAAVWVVAADGAGLAAAEAALGLPPALL